MKFKLVAFDLDGVLVKSRGSWWELHKAFGTFDDSKTNLNNYEIGKITYEDFMRHDIALWGKRHFNEVKSILLNYETIPYAQEIINKFKNRGMDTAIISSGIDILAKDVAQKLSINHVVANGLEFDKFGFLTGKGIFRVDLFRKDLALLNLIESLNINPIEVVAIGDSKYDTRFLSSVGLGIAFNSDDEELLRVAKTHVISLQDIPPIIEAFEKKT